MTARIIDGTATAQSVYAALAPRVRALLARGVKPRLAAVQFGENAASKVYLRTKMRACEAAGVQSETRQFPVDCPQAEALRVIREMNTDPAVHGILVQLPLPAHLDPHPITQAIAPGKDVDGFNWTNLGALIAGRAAFEPCTPRGVMVLLERAGVSIEGSGAVIVGRSNIVGKPLALMLVNRGATVTMCHTKTTDLARRAREADILVVAAGRAHLVTGAMIKPGAAVIDVGINRDAAGKLVGDVDYASACQVAGCITPVPGGVGPMTVAMLIENTVLAAERAAGLAA